MKKDRQEEQEEMETETPRVNPGYALGQIAKALTTTQEHEDVETRTRAQKKIAKWEGILRGLDTGSLDVGSCTPVKDVPKWATLEVATGGFATGALLAGGPLLEHETKLLADLRSTAGADARRNLNRFHLTDQGLARLQEMLGSGCYDVTVPEEGALLVVAWLVSNGRSDAARDLIEMLAPYFGRLRFYPVPIEQPRRFGTHVFVQDVAATIQNLKRIKPNEHILAQKEAIQVWTPLYDRMVGLFLETVDGESPRLIKDATGNGKFPTEGGWPCQQYPDGWKGRARAVLNECTQMQNLHKRCGRPERAKDSFNQLRDHLHCCVNDPSALTGREVGKDPCNPCPVRLKARDTGFPGLQANPRGADRTGGWADLPRDLRRGHLATRDASGRQRVGSPLVRPATGHRGGIAAVEDRRRDGGTGVSAGEGPALPDGSRGCTR